jgi:Ca2+-binding RTX toxin-like protein
LTEEIRIAHAGKNDTLLVRGSIGGDVIDAGGLAAGKIALKLDGDAGDDTLFGSDGNDTATGGAGNDVASLGTGNDLFVGGTGNDVASLGAGNDRARGDAGNDRALLGAGNDVFIWRPGDGFDTVDGQAGFDTFDFNGGQADVVILDIAGRANFSSVGVEGAVLTDVERIRVQASDGSDVVHMTSLAGTDVRQVLILDFDGNPLGGQDVLDLDPLFDALGVGSANRAGRVSIVDNGATVDVFVNADGNAGNGFELAVATLQTHNTITLGQDVVVEFF